jgi:eukaryotic-like serine/threonine-protein kinase
MDLRFPSQPRAPRQARDADRPQVLLREGELVAKRFRIERLAALGGMGAVYQAWDEPGKQPAAVKVVARPRGEGVERFARESSLLAELSHPAIVRYLAHGLTDASAPFLAMEWLDGHDLAAHLRTQPLTLDESFALVRRICEGLQLAHRHGVIHRDVKPSNIFLPRASPRDAKLIDFGIAHQQSEAPRLTEAGAQLGTVGYMAPEQAMGESDIDARADVFAVGCVLHEVLTGRPAFTASHKLAVMGKVLREEPPRVSELNAGLGGDIDELVARMIAKAPEQRFGSIDELLRALNELRVPTGIPPLPLAISRRERAIGAEQRIVSVILGRGLANEPITMPRPDAERLASAFEDLTRQFDADWSPLRGGGLLLVLGADRLANASDRATKAARCALRMHALRPELTLAVATGSFETTLQGPVGAAIDRAAGLLAEDDPVDAPALLVDELTAGLFGGKFDLQQRADGALLLIGELEELDAPRLLMGKLTPCVGRDKELALLEATLAECSEDHVARAVLVTSPPGIGKSRLGRELVARARSRGSARVLTARADPLSAGSSLGLMHRLIRSAVGLPTGQDPLRQQQALRSYLQNMVGEEALPWTHEFMCELLGVPLHTTACSLLMRTARADSEVMREQYRRVLECWLDAECAQRPLLLLFEDLHWGDLPSIVYIDDALRTFASRPIMVLALARPEIQDTLPRLWARAGAQVIPLQPLTRRAAERLVGATLSGATPEAITSRIIALSEGNAFFLEELIRRAAEGGTEFPETVLAMVQSRLDGLDPEARRVLRAASVFGEVAWAAGVDALLCDRTSELLLDELVHTEILVPHANSRYPDQREFAFRHALLRDAAYATLAPVDVAPAHAAAGDWLARHGERDALLLADHFERGGKAARAVPLLVRSALAAVEGGDFPGAIKLARRGLAIGASGHDRGTLLLVSSTAASWGLHAPAEMDELREALDRLPHASSQWWLALSGLIFGSSEKGDAEAGQKYLELAASTAPGPELTAYYGQSLQTLGSTSVVIGQPEIGWALVGRFDTIAVDDPRCDQLFLVWRDIARSFLATYSTHEGRWLIADALGWSRDSVAAMRSAGSKFGESVALYMYGTLWLFCGVYDQAEQTFVASIQAANQTGTRLMAQYSELLLSWVRLRLGRADEASAGLTLCAASQDFTIAHGVQCARAELLAHGGDLQGALQCASTATLGAAAPYRRMAWCTVARMHEQLGEPKRALAAVESAAADGNPCPNLEFEGQLRLIRARALRALGDEAGAQRAVQEALTFLDDVAQQLREPWLRDAFLERVEAHRALRELAQSIFR